MSTALDPWPPPIDKEPLAGGSLRNDQNEQTTSANRTAENRQPQEAPEHRNDRRRFLIWALMAGYTKPERVVERIVAEVKEEQA